MEKIATLFHYETIKLVTITNWKMGLIHRSIQVVILCYIAFYAIWWDQGYQKTSQIEGVLYSKVKGIAIDQNGIVYDSGDLIQPATEANSLFVTTQFLQTVQTENSTCFDPEASCTDNTACVAGTFTSNGAIQPTCDTINQGCLIKGWCPVEHPSAPVTRLSRIPEWTVLLRTHVTYIAFTEPNAANNADKAELGYNIFKFGDLEPLVNWTSMQATGGIIAVKIDWSCNLDAGIENCRPIHQAQRVDSVNGASVGFNYRKVTYLVNSDPQNGSVFPQRVYTKLYGVRFVFQITGTGRRADLAATIVTLGSGFAFFSIAPVIVDVILQYVHPKKQMFAGVKREVVDLTQ